MFIVATETATNDADPLTETGSNRILIEQSESSEQSEQSELTTNTSPLRFKNTTVPGNSFLDQALPTAAIIPFVLILFIIAAYLLYIYLCNHRRRFRTRVFSSTKVFRAKRHKSYTARPPVDHMSSQLFFGRQPPPPPPPFVNKELNLQPATNDVASLQEEFRSIIASKLKKPPSTLETLIEPKNDQMDVEIKEQEQENDDVFNVISAKSLEKYRSSKLKNDKVDRPKKETFETSDTTESENVDKVIVLRSGSTTDTSLKGLTNKLSKFRSRSLSSGSRSRQSKTGIRRVS